MWKRFYIAAAHTLEYVKYGLRDPSAALAYLIYSQNGLNYLFTKRLLSLSKEEYAIYLGELRRNVAFSEYVEQALKGVGTPLGEIQAQGAELLYVITRVLNPEIVVETGVAAGVSSAFILMALQENDFGKLYSIDMPNYDLELSRRGVIPTPVSMFPNDKFTGFAIPPNLKHRWHLLIGLSKDVLPPLLKQLKEIDMFLHDSEHSYEGMMFEYDTSWPYIRKGGVLLSHDISMNPAFSDFQKAVKKKSYHCYFSSIGGIRK